MYRLGDNAQKSYVVHRRLTIEEINTHISFTTTSYFEEIRKTIIIDLYLIM